MPRFLRRERGLFWLAAVGYAVGLAAVVGFLALPDHGIASDADAYWLAGHHVLAGSPLYDADVLVKTYGAWKYPPIFAQILAPFSIVPELAFSWLWRTVCFLSLRGIVGSWRNTGLALLVPFVWNEMAVANVTFPVALIALHSVRGRPLWLPVAIALKFGPALLVPFILLRRGTHDCQQLLIGLGVFAGACGASVLTMPGAWHDYLATIAPQAAGITSGVALSSSGAVDVVLRGGLAAIAVVVAIVFDEERLAWAAAVVTVPVLFVSRLAPLVGLFAWQNLAGRSDRPKLALVVPGFAEA